MDDSGIDAGADAAAALFSALGDATRLRVLSRLSSGGPASATTLSVDALVSRQAVHRHLEILAAAGVVRSARRGRERVWEVTPERLADAHAWLDTVSTRWDDALERLRALVEKT